MVLLTTRDNDYLYFVSIAVGIFILPVTTVISVLIYIPIYCLAFFCKRYGKFISYTDVWLDEDLTNTPKSSLVTTLTLQGNLSLDQLKYVFKTNVLEARSKANPSKPRYPELKQFVTTFLCFRIWENDPNFLIENHIKEKTLKACHSDKLLLDAIHQEYLNKPYQAKRSPWELVLIRNVNIKNDSSECEDKSLLVFGLHHVMADTKSVLKLLVECLGKKELKTATPEEMRKETIWNTFKFVVTSPLNYVTEQNKLLRLIFQSYHHPWRNKLSFRKKTDPSFEMLVSFSPEINMIDLKRVANKNNVKTSAVLMSIVSGAIKKICGDKWDKEVLISYHMPRPYHPEFLTNHMYMGFLGLPTDQVCEFKRLQSCNAKFVDLKVNQQFRYLHWNVIRNGIQVYPLCRYYTNMPAPIAITNNAGEEDGFSVGNLECLDYRMSVGLPHGFTGVVFCTMSYKGKLRISVIADKSILKKEMVTKLANNLGVELQLLLKSL